MKFRCWCCFVLSSFFGWPINKFEAIRCKTKPLKERRKKKNCKLLVILMPNYPNKEIVQHFYNRDWMSMSIFSTPWLHHLLYVCVHFLLVAPSNHYIGQLKHGKSQLFNSFADFIVCKHTTMEKWYVFVLEKSMHCKKLR